jgi:hypothetical protein
VALLTLAVAAAGCGGSGGPSTWTVTYADCAEQSPPCASRLQMEPASPADAKAARRVADDDQVLASLLAGAQVTSQPWTELDGKRLGAALLYTLPRPRPVHAVLPYVAIPPASGDCVHPYAQGWLRVDAKAVETLTVLVDLQRGRVVDARPDSGVVTYSWVPGKPHLRCEETASG